MADLLDVGQVRVGGRDAFADLNLVRTLIRQELYGRAERVGATAEVVWPDGSVVQWDFGPEVGYPTNIPNTWLADWIEAYS